MQFKTTTHKALKITTLTLLGLLPSAALADWTGSYAGLSFDLITNGDATARFDGDDEQSATLEGGTIFSGFAGYQMQQGAFVFGGELAITNATDVEGKNDGFESKFDARFVDIKARAGYDAGNVLVYGVAGFSQFKDLDSSEGEDTAQGFNLGIGADYLINDQFVIGAEYLSRHATLEESFGETDVDIDTLSLRASFKF